MMYGREAAQCEEQARAAKEWVRRGGCAGQSGVALGVEGDRAAFSSRRCQGRPGRVAVPANYLGNAIAQMEQAGAQ
jgi:hypothetical protein